MYLKLREFGGISFHPEESVSLSIVRVGPYLGLILVCIPPFIDYLFRVVEFSCFLYFDLFQVKVQLFLSGMMDYIIFCIWIVYFNICMKLDLVVMFCRLFS